MAGTTLFPGAVDDNTTLPEDRANATTTADSHPADHNNLAAAIKATQTEVLSLGTSAVGISPADVIVASNDMPTAYKNAVIAAGGLVCDGTNDQVQINSAIDQATSLSGRSSPGSAAPTVTGATQRGRVQLSGGRFEVSGPILLRSGVHLAGMGPGTEVRAEDTYVNAGSGTRPGIIKLFNDSTHMVVVSDMFLHGASAGGDTFTTGIYFEGLNNSYGAYPSSGNGDAVTRIEGIWIEALTGTGANGIMYRNVSGSSALRACYITNCRIRNMTNGIDMASTPDGHIQFVQIGTCSGSGFAIAAANYKLSNLKAFYCDTYAFELSGDRCSGAVLEAQDSATGFLFSGSQCVWSSVIAETFSNDGIVFSGSSIDAAALHVQHRGSSGRYASGLRGYTFSGSPTDLHIGPAGLTTANITTPISGTPPSATTGRSWIRIRSNGSTTEPTIGSAPSSGGVFIGN